PARPAKHGPPGARRAGAHPRAGARSGRAPPRRADPARAVRNRRPVRLRTRARGAGRQPAPHRRRADGGEELPDRAGPPGQR
nr:hypothetical protein [Tanacetum cinerariifolium]